jgi:ferredoxin
MAITVYEGSIKHELAFEEGESILKVLQNAGIQSITAPCGGKGMFFE